jgi:hypothetical protein
VVVGFRVGLALFLAGVLVAAGAAKLLNLELTRTTLGRLLGPGRRGYRRVLPAAASGLGTGEVLLGAALASAPTRVVPASAAAALCLGFVVAVWRARRLGTACGCFGSLSSRVSGPVELARAAALSVLSGLLLALNASGAGNGVDPALPGIVLGLLGAALATVLPMAWAGNARTPGELRALLLPRPTGWRAAGFPARQRILRTVRTLRDVRDVERCLGRPVPWRRAQVRITGRPATVASVMVVYGHRRMQVTLPREGPATVLGRTRYGPVTPATARAAAPAAGVRSGG